jgi:CheY-like chemotaxis protein
MIDLDSTPVLLVDLARSVLDVIGVQATHKKIELKTEFAEGVPLAVMTDTKRLRQVLINLVGNAVKFTDRGSVTLRLSTVNEATLSRLRFEVQDTGIGIPVAARDKLFREFSQVDASINRRFGGTGLGLAICKKIVMAMGGRIGVESTEGAGSCFWFEIDAPLCDAPAEALAPTAANGKTGGAYRILVVEDMPVNRIVARGMLTSLGHSVDLACDGLEALEKLETISYDLVFMDMQMPKMNGLEATRKIRSGSGPAARLPIIAMTANAFQSDRQECLSAGMNDFVSKPVELNELNAAIRRVMPSSQAIQEWAAPRRTLCDTRKLTALTEYIGINGLAEILEEFLIDSQQLFDEMEAAIKTRSVERGFAALDGLGEAMTTLGLVEAAAEAALLRRDFAEAGRLEDEALERFRALVARSLEDARGWLVDYAGKTPSVQPPLLASLT